MFELFLMVAVVILKLFFILLSRHSYKAFFESCMNKLQSRDIKPNRESEATFSSSRCRKQA